MVKTITRMFGDKEFVLPAKIPYAPLKWFQTMVAKGNRTQSELLEELMMRVVIEPKITKEYFETEADIDDFALMNALSMDIADAMDERVYDLKKKLQTRQE